MKSITINARHYCIAVVGAVLAALTASPWNTAQDILRALLKETSS